MFTFINHSEKRTENRHLVSIKKLGKYNTLLNQFDGDNEKLMAWAKSEAAKETELYNERTGKVTVEFSHAACIPMNEVRSFHAGYLFLQQLCTELRLDNICREINGRHKFKYDFLWMLTAFRLHLIFFQAIRTIRQRSSHWRIKS